MAQGKTKNILGDSGLSAKSITGAVVTVHGSVVAIELTYSGGSEFIKVKHGLVELGGTNEWGSGTVQNF